MTSMWGIVAAERGALADDLAGLTDEQWNTPSLCSEWSVREALAHMTGTATTTPVSFVTGLAAARFRFGDFLRAGIERNLGASPAETLAKFRAQQHSTKSPPGPKVSWLGEAVIHAEDIRRPLGISHTYDVEGLRQVADFYKGSNTLIGAKNRIAGLQLQASDTDWTHGSGDLVEGPLLDLVLAMTGRAAACANLSGPGVATLAGRCS